MQVRNQMSIAQQELVYRVESGDSTRALQVTMGLTPYEVDLALFEKLLETAQVKFSKDDYALFKGALKGAIERAKEAEAREQERARQLEDDKMDLRKFYITPLRRSVPQRTPTRTQEEIDEYFGLR